MSFLSNSVEVLKCSLGSKNQSVDGHGFFLSGGKKPLPTRESFFPCGLVDETVSES